MQSASYFRRQANTCLRFSLSCTDQTLADRFQAIAQDLMAKAEDAEAGKDGECVPPPHILRSERAAD